MGHMRIVRLSNVGHFADGPAEEKDGHYEKDVVLVHEGEFNSMDGPVVIDPPLIDLFAANHNSLLAKCKRLATGEIPMKNYPPIQLDHSSSAMMTVGRLVGDLSAEDVEIDGGKKVRALKGRMRILGAENIEKVKDGRWTHVSIGADLEDGKINELSITPFPADPNAAMLSRNRLGRSKGKKSYRVGYQYEIFVEGDGGATQVTGYVIYFDGRPVLERYGAQAGDTVQRAERWAMQDIDYRWKNDMDSLSRMSKGSKGENMKLTERLKKLFKLSEEKEEKKDLSEAEERAEKLKKHLMEEEKLSAEDADEKLSKMSDEELSKLSEDVEKKELARASEGDEEAKEEAKMAAARVSAIKLGKALVAANRDVQLAARKAKIGARLTALRKEKKITPAELKKVDVANLAAMSEDQAATILKTYSDREPVLDTEVHGSATAVNLSTIAAKYKAAKLEAETRMSMPSKAKEAKAQLAAIEAEEKKEIEEAKASGATEQHYEPSYAELSKFIPSDKTEAFKVHLKKFLAGETDEGTVGEKQMSELDEKIKLMQTQMKELLQLVGSLTGCDEKEFE